jgi:hypothetical protein
MMITGLLMVMSKYRTRVSDLRVNKPLPLAGHFKLTTHMSRIELGSSRLPFGILQSILVNIISWFCRTMNSCRCYQGHRMTF